MNFDFLPSNILNVISKLNVDKLYQIRLRAEYSISVIYDNRMYFLNNNGLTRSENGSIKCFTEDLYYIIESVTEHSIYAFNDKLLKGYLTTKDGIRIGIAGECVFENSNIIAVKNITSLNVRIPHEIKNCSNLVFERIVDKDKLNNTLIISPPFCGKTTLLKDIALKLNNLSLYQILILDERGEFSSVTGKNIDVIKFSDKKYGFLNGLRSLSPNVVITDELSEENDWTFPSVAVNSGVKIIASCHSDSIDSLLRRKSYIENVFERYILLENGKFGVIKKVYDSNFKEI